MAGASADGALDVMDTRSRMPVILASARDYGRWLVPRDAARLPLDLLRPLPAEETEPRTVSCRVGNVLNNGPGLVELSLQ